MTIHSSETLLYARIVFDPQRVPDYEFDTSGTNISVSIDSSSFLLTGADTAEHYQAVLRSARVGYVIGAAGDISSFEITVTSAAGTSASVNSLVTTVLLPPPTIDLNGSEPGINVETTVYAYRGAQNQPLFSDDTLTIDSPYSDNLVGAQVYFDTNPGDVTVDTAGTNIVVTRSGNSLILEGVASVEDYERALRSLTFVNLQWWPQGETHQVQFTLTGSVSMVAPATAIVIRAQCPC